MSRIQCGSRAIEASTHAECAACDEEEHADRIDEDTARAELDRRLLVNVLGLDEALLADGGPIHRLRLKLASEPQIHGNKGTRVVFTDEGETAVARGERD